MTTWFGTAQATNNTTNTAYVGFMDENNNQYLCDTPIPNNGAAANLDFSNSKIPSNTTGCFFFTNVSKPPYMIRSTTPYNFTYNGDVELTIIIEGDGAIQAYQA